MRFFFDACVPEGLVRALAGVQSDKPDKDELVHHYAVFGRESVADVEWLRALRKKGGDWFIVSSDERIRANPKERLAWQETGLTAFFLSDFARRDRYAQASALFKAWPEVVRQAREGGGGRGWRVPFKGGKLIEVPFGATGS